MDDIPILNQSGILFVGEEFREDGTDRTSIVARMLMFCLRDLLNIVLNKSGRADLTPEQVTRHVGSGCYVVLVDVNRGDATPKIQAALSALKPGQPFKYVLPIDEQMKAVEAGALRAEEVAPIEIVALGYVNHWIETADKRKS